MVPWQGLHSTYLAAKYLRENHIEGSIVECGVYKGGASMIMAHAAGPDRDFYMYDTYQGMSEPTDVDFKGQYYGQAYDTKKKFNELNKGSYVDWCHGPIEEVRKLISDSNLPDERFNLIKGKVEDTLETNFPDQIALLRLDTDFYESTKHELECLYPLISDGGILIIDDYGAWAGARKAVDDYFANIQVKPLLIPDSYYGALIGIISKRNQPSQDI
jgi:hypothetical protein